MGELEPARAASRLGQRWVIATDPPATIRGHSKRRVPSCMSLTRGVCSAVGACGGTRNTVRPARIPIGDDVIPGPMDAIDERIIVWAGKS